MAQRQTPLVVLPGTLMTWRGLRLHRRYREDFYKTRGGTFEWEVDASLDEDDEYEARVSFKGVKLASGRASTRQAALAKALQELRSLESKIGNEARARGEDDRVKKNDRG